MNLLTPLALIGLVALPILVVLHLRRRRPRMVDVPSLLLWEGLVGETRQRASWLRLPSLPLLLLQLIAVALLVGGLARPVTTAAPVVQRATQVYIVDDSVWMSATDLAPNRLAVAKDMVKSRIGRASPGTLFAIVVASSQPYLLVSTPDPARARHFLAMVHPTEERADFATAFRLAAGTLSAVQEERSHITVLHAPENTVPAITGLSAVPTMISVGRSSDDQGILRFSVRCPVEPKRACGAFATIHNQYGRLVRDDLVIRGDGDLLARQALTLPPHLNTNLSFTVPRGQRIVQLVLSRPDILPADNSAWYVVAPNPRLRVTLIGPAGHTAGLQRALSALPGVSLHVGTPRQYSPADAERSDLLVLDGWRPPGPLPPAPSLLLIDPRSLPGGRVGPSPSDATISGEDTASPLLTNVDLMSLDIPPEAVRTVTSPAWAAPVVWAAAGPLLSAGSDGGQRVAIVDFDPAQTNLPQLSAFPLLLWNILRWSAAWLPAGVVPGESAVIIPSPATTTVQMTVALSGKSILTAPISSDRPLSLTLPRAGVYAITERTPAGNRTALLAANADMAAPAAAGTLHLSLTSVVPGQRTSIVSRELVSWWPWIGLVALLVILVEWWYVARREA